MTRGMRILLVEVEQGLRGEIAERLARDGCTVRVASSAWHALATLQEDPLPDLVAMDLGCPEGCGDWLLRECRADERLTRLSILSPQETLHRAAAHQGIGQHVPCGPPLGSTEPTVGKIISFLVLSGLHHDYRRAA